jgi:hypothetical protein
LFCFGKPRIIPTKYYYSAVIFMKPYQEALLLMVLISLPLAFAAPALDCPALCQPKETCLCTVKGCSNGMLIFQNKVGQPINLTAFLLSGGFPVNSFSNDNYAASFNPSWGGTVGVRLVCFTQESMGSVEKKIIVPGLPSPVLSSSRNGTLNTSSDQNINEIQAKLLAQIAVQKLEAVITSAPEDKRGQVAELLSKAKLALAEGDYTNAQKYANEGYALGVSAETESKLEGNRSENSLMNAITSIDPLVLSLAATAVIIAVLILGVYLYKKRKAQF